MSSVLNPLSNLVIQRWEEANAQVTSVLSNYLSSCIALESLSYLPNPPGAQNLALELDHIIDFLRNTASEQLARSYSSLARTRNKLATSIYSLPPEVLSEIFRLAIYAPEKARPSKESVKIIYRRLHTLISVCSVWRKVGLAQSELWSIIPLIDNGREDPSYATQLSLQRSGNSKIYIAADLRHMPESMDFITENAARFHALNIRSDSNEIRDFISLWLEHGVPGSVTDLSICNHHTPRPASYDSDSPEPAESANVFDYLCSRGSRMRRLLSRFMAPLSTLRISGVLPHLSNITFDDLIELRIDKVDFDTYTGYAAFLMSLSSIPSLRLLHLESVSTWGSWDSGADPNKSTNSPPISLPSLQTLHLGNLFPELLKITFKSIAPGSYRLVLCLGDRSLGCYPSNEYQFEENWSAKPLLPIFRGRDVSALLLDIAFPAIISELLQNLPTLRCLVLYSLNLSKKRVMEMLIPPSGNNVQFPVLRELSVADVMVRGGSSAELFKKVVSSHAFESITLGGDPHGFEAENSQSRWRPLYPSDEIVTWLGSTVSNFRLIDRQDGLPEFNNWNVWQLW